MACPSCFGLMFVGSQFCGHCGARAVSAGAGTRTERGECPRCRTGLDDLRIGEIELDECQKCGGLWADAETFERICADREEQSAFLGNIAGREHSAGHPAKISYVPCPECKQLMNRSNFARASGVIIDSCKQHGVWFDADELPKIIQFIQKGGMQMAREKEKMDITEQRQRLRDDRRRQAAMDQKHGTGANWNRDEGSGISGFIRSLFE